MAEVPAITSDTNTVTELEPSNIRHEDDNFLELYEKAKQNFLAGGANVFGLSAFFDIPMNFGGTGTTRVNRTTFSPQIYDRPQTGTSRVSSSSDDSARADEAKAKQGTTTSQAETRSQQAKNAAATVENIAKPLIADLEFTPEFTNMIINAKNRTAGLLSVDVDDLINQVKDRIKFLKDNGKVELSIELKPENLGSIIMSITRSKGAVSINIFADAQARRALDSSLADLEKALKQANINVTDLHVLPDGKRRNNAHEYLADMLYNGPEREE